MIVVLLACAPPAEPPEAGETTHFAEWPRLMAAAEREDLAAVRRIARDLSMGDVADDGPGAAQVGGALGYLQLFDDPSELPTALTRAHAGCTACHERLGLSLPRGPAPR